MACPIALPRLPRGLYLLCVTMDVAIILRPAWRLISSKISGDEFATQAVTAHLRHIQHAQRSQHGRQYRRQLRLHWGF
ncbi:hypothetical protein A9179_10560 [Pseudomonas alcaligenes]|uniref:Secreted protein n=1 Tax=Aquipseudomonas alcaligenes TaxID=43263 RepID=A0ABR7RZT4_AQUAC|nr:hypothetical protein [Pseudomonas alcaligenes]